MTVLIGLHGPKESGKDTAYSFIYQWGDGRGVRAARRGFADAVKLSIAKTFDPSVTITEAVSFCDKLKAPGSTISFSMRVEHGQGESRTYSGEITGRMFIQRFATEAHRDVFGEDIWLDAVLPLTRPWIRSFEDNPFLAEPIEIAVITDLRFSNEAQRVKELGGQVWLIDRHDFTSEHSSEVLLPPEMIDRTISNKGTLEDFAAEVFGAMDAEFAGLVADE
jgi:hypothetical protein